MTPVSHGKPCAGNPHARFDEGASASEEPRRKALLHNITVRQCMIGETEWFRRLEGKYHYMGESHGAGDLVRLVFEEDGRPVALMTWAAAGAKDLKAAHAFARRLSNAQLGELGCPKAKDALGNEVRGRYVCPSYNAFYHLLRHKDKAGRHDFDVADYAAHLSKWMTAQHGKLPRHLAADGKFVDEVVGLVSVVDAESGDVVAVAPASRKEGLKGRCEYPVLRETLSGMDLSGAIVSTDALSCQDDTAHTVLANGGDYVLQVKANRRGLMNQCRTLCRIRPLVSSSKKKS